MDLDCSFRCPSAACRASSTNSPGASRPKSTSSKAQRTRFGPTRLTLNLQACAAVPPGRRDSPEVHAARSGSAAVLLPPEPELQANKLAELLDSLEASPRGGEHIRANAVMPLLRAAALKRLPGRTRSSGSPPSDLGFPKASRACQQSCMPALLSLSKKASGGCGDAQFPPHESAAAASPVCHRFGSAAATSLLRYGSPHLRSRTLCIASLDVPNALGTPLIQFYDRCRPRHALAGRLSQAGVQRRRQGRCTFQRRTRVYARLTWAILCSPRPCRALLRHCAA